MDFNYISPEGKSEGGEKPLYANGRPDNGAVGKKHPHNLTMAVNAGRVAEKKHKKLFCLCYFKVVY